MLTAAVAVVEYAGSPDAKQIATPGTSFTGLVAVLLSVVISGFGVVYLEGTLKETSAGTELETGLAVR